MIEKLNNQNTELKSDNAVKEYLNNMSLKHIEDLVKEQATTNKLIE